jgi:hypothetical protein
MSSQTISKDLLNVTSSQGSEAGVTPCVSLDGQMTGQCGPALVPANLSPRQAKEAGLLMSGTYGPVGSISSSSANLSRSLANKLKLQSDRVGSTLYKLTWKESVTPLGRLVSRLAASVLRTLDKDFTSWPTPNSTNGDKSVRTLEGAEKEAERFLEKIHAVSLNDQVMLATWATPSTRDWKDNNRNEHNGNKPGRLTADALRSIGATSGTSGHWRDADWVYCRDEKYRAVEPGTFPLAHGATNRVGRLRGYGNCIVIPQAQAFIEAYLHAVKT